MFSFICAWINGWINNRKAGNLRRHRAQYDVIVMACRVHECFMDVTITWWRHEMETFSALLAICAGNSPVPGEFTAQRPVTRSFDVFFDLHPNKRLSKQSWDRWFETPQGSLWRQCNEMHAKDPHTVFPWNSVRYNHNSSIQVNQDFSILNCTSPLMSTAAQRTGVLCFGSCTKSLIVNNARESLQTYAFSGPGLGRVHKSRVRVRVLCLAWVRVRVRVLQKMCEYEYEYEYFSLSTSTSTSTSYPKY